VAKNNLPARRKFEEQSLFPHFSQHIVGLDLQAPGDRLDIDGKPVGRRYHRKGVLKEEGEFMPPFLLLGCLIQTLPLTLNSVGL